MVVEVKRIPALDTKELAVDARPVAIVAANHLVIANTQSRLAAIGAVRANGAHMFHFPRPRLIPIRTAGQRAYRTDIDALSALIAIQMVAFIGRNQ